MTNDPGQPAQTFASIGIDIGKDVFHIVGFDPQGKIVLRKKFKRQFSRISANVREGSRAPVAVRQPHRPVEPYDRKARAG